MNIENKCSRKSIFLLFLNSSTLAVQLSSMLGLEHAKYRSHTPTQSLHSYKIMVLEYGYNDIDGGIKHCSVVAGLLQA